MRKLVFAFSLVLMIGFATASIQEVQYSIDTGVEGSEINTSIFMSCDSACTGLRWSVPENSEVLFVRNSGGEMDYEIEESKIDVSGSRAKGRENETIKIGLRTEKEADEIYEGLYQRSLSIPSFSDVETTGFVRNENLLSGRIGFGFDYSFTDEEMRFKGKGPTNVRIKFGKGQSSKYFEFFGSKPEETESAYEVPIGVLGFRQNFNSFPAAVMTDSDYDRIVNEWSDGEYVGGSLKIREPKSIGEGFLPVLAHEVVHGLNDRRLNWDQTRSSYFDEGVAKYVDSLMRKKLYNDEEIDRPPQELFGEEVRYDPDPSDREYYEIPSKGDKEMLWSYYQNDRDFMKTWNAFEADSETRKFGYAYSKVRIDNQISRENGSIRDLYSEFSFDKKINDPDEKWDVFSQYLTMDPCNYDSRERFESCIEQINDYDYPVYSAQPDSSSEFESIQINRLKVPNRTEPSGSLSQIRKGNVDVNEEDVNNFVSRFIDYLLSLFNSLLEYL